MLRAEIEQVNQIAKGIASESVNAAVSVFAAKIAELEVRVKRLSESIDRLSKTKLKGGLE